MKHFIFFLLIPFFMSSQSSLNDAQKLIDMKEFKKAEQLLLAYIKTDQNNLEAIELYGDTYGFQEKWDEAIIQYKKLVDGKPKNANFHYKYGGALGMKALSINKMKALGIIGDVKEAFLNAAELDPKHIEARWALVELYMQLPGIIGGSKSKSLKYAKELKVLSKVDGYLAYGYIYEYDDEPELAEKYYKLAINEGGSLTCYDKLTDLYKNENQPNKAIDNLEASGEKHKRNAMHYQIGKVCAEYNIQLDKGEKCLLIYIDNYSAKDGVPKAWAYFRMAQINTFRKNKKEALKWIDKAIADLPKIDVFKEEKMTIQAL
jgi:tetratricopeptide (TPR) repeat protein